MCPSIPHYHLSSLRTNTEALWWCRPFRITAGICLTFVPPGIYENLSSFQNASTNVPHHWNTASCPASRGIGLLINWAFLRSHISISKYWNLLNRSEGIVSNRVLSVTDKIVSVIDGAEAISSTPCISTASLWNVAGKRCPSTCMDHLWLCRRYVLVTEVVSASFIVTKDSLLYFAGKFLSVCLY